MNRTHKKNAYHAKAQPVTGKRRLIKPWQAAFLLAGAVAIMAGYAGGKHVHSSAILQNRPWIEISKEFRRGIYSEEELAFERKRAMEIDVPLIEGIIGKHTEKTPKGVEIGVPAERERLVLEALTLMKHVPISGMKERTWYDFFRSNAKKVCIDTASAGMPVARGGQDTTVTVFARALGNFHKLPNKDRIFQLSAVLAHEASHNYFMQIGGHAQKTARERFRYWAGLVAHATGLKIRQKDYRQSMHYYFAATPGILEEERAANSVANRFLLDFKKVDKDADIEPMMRKNDVETARYRRAANELDWLVYSHIAKALGIAAGILAALFVILPVMLKGKHENWQTPGA